MSDLTPIIEAAKQYATHIIIDYPEQMVYHNIKFARRYVDYVTNICEQAGISEENHQLGIIGAWLVSASYKDVRMEIVKGQPKGTFTDELQKTAILSIRPNTTHGRFTEDQIRNKQVNLLFYGNFHEMKFSDYEWGFLQMLNDQDYLYSSMVKDIYFLGKQLSKKFKLIRISLTIFIVGFTLAVIAFFN